MRIIRGKYGRRRFDVPGNITARPTTDFARENIFNVIENHIDIDGISALDLFAGTGAITFELLSRGAARVTAIEKASTQYRFIEKVAQILGADNLRLVRGDVFRYIESGIIKPGGLFVMEHSAKRDYSLSPCFIRHLAYGSVNFSIFLLP